MGKARTGSLFGQYAGPNQYAQTGGTWCEFCERGCKCGKEVMTEGTCVFCGHGLAHPVTRGVDPMDRIWGRDEMIRAAQWWFSTYRETPRFLDWRRPGEFHPGVAQVLRFFETWKDFIIAAGLTPPAAGRPPNREVTHAA